MNKKLFTKKQVNKKTGEVTTLYQAPSQKEEETPKKDKKKDKRIGFPFLPGPAGTSPYHKRRVEDGGKIVRLKRK